MYHFIYQSQLFLEKYFFETNQEKNEQLVNNINDWLIDLRNVVVKKSEENSQCYIKNPWF